MGDEYYWLIFSLSKTLKLLLSLKSFWEFFLKQKGQATVKVEKLPKTVVIKEIQKRTYLSALTDKFQSWSWSY